MPLSDKISAGTATYEDFAPFGDLHELAWRAYCPPEGSLDAAWRLYRLTTGADLFDLWDVMVIAGLHHRPEIAILLAVIDYRDQQ